MTQPRAIYYHGTNSRYVEQMVSVHGSYTHGLKPVCLTNSPGLAMMYAQKSAYNRLDTSPVVLMIDGEAIRDRMGKNNAGYETVGSISVDCFVVLRVEGRGIDAKLAVEPAFPLDL